MPAGICWHCSGGHDTSDCPYRNQPFSPDPRLRTSAEEAVLRAAVAFARGPAGLGVLDAAVDALLRENPAWGEEGK